MPVITTRTLNPLPFGDLEPHRFEDLVRQLAYDLRAWKSLEATGRAGSDDGIDIRGSELIDEPSAVLDEDEAEQDPVSRAQERLWIFQCKREKSLAPAPVKKAIDESIPSGATPPHGFVLAIAADVSKKARDLFRAEMVKRGVQEFQIWARGELEDMLFQAKNDRLLFAYFGISLQPRRRSLATQLRSAVTLKKQLNSLLFGKEDANYQDKYVLLRDVNARYPPEKRSGPRAPGLAVCEALHLLDPGHLCVLWHERPAWVSEQKNQWDALKEHDAAIAGAASVLQSKHAWVSEERPARDSMTALDFWREYVPEEERAWLRELRFVELSRVVAIDPLGDGYYPIPHLLMEFDPSDGPFSPGNNLGFRSDDRRGGFGRQFRMTPAKETRMNYFPTPLPQNLFPPPPRFEHPRSATVATLEPSTTEKVGALLTAVHADDKNARTRSTSSRPSSEPGHLIAFRQWIDTVGNPVFQAFVDTLTASGQDARIVRASSPVDEFSLGNESIELRLRLPCGAYNPDYRRPGHVRLSASGQASRVMVEVEPRAESNDRYSPAAAVNDQQPTKQQLEQMVLDVLTRLRSER